MLNQSAYFTNAKFCIDLQKQKEYSTGFGLFASYFKILLEC